MNMIVSNKTSCRVCASTILLFVTHLHGMHGLKRSSSEEESSRIGIDHEIFVEPNDCLRETDKVLSRRDATHVIQKLYNCTESTQKPSRILVTGGAGFVGSHLVDRLMLSGHQVIVCDDLSTGRMANVKHWLGHPNFKLIEQDVARPLSGIGAIDSIYHLASPASPKYYLQDPIKTIKTNTLGTINMLELSKNTSARLILASTSEIYGDPEMHPQPETYWGNTNPIGPRSCYDESKRVAESLVMAYHRQHNVSVGIARIFNTYGPRMQSQDGRVVSNFIWQSLTNSPITIYGHGQQTRSFQYVSDLIEGLVKLMSSNVMSPVNLGNPNEMTIVELADLIQKAIPESKSSTTFKELPIDDPHKRRPDIRKAKKLLNWEPQISLATGLGNTIAYFNKELRQKLK